MWTLGSRKQDVAGIHGYNDGAFPATVPMMKGLSFYILDKESNKMYTGGFMVGMWHRHIRILKGWERPFGYERLLYPNVRKRAWFV